MSFDARLTVIGKTKHYDYETITIADTAIGLTAAKLLTTVRPNKVLISIETAQCRWRMDGTDPTNAIGIILNPMDTMEVEGLVNLKQIRFIRTGATSAKAQVSYMR